MKILRLLVSSLALATAAAVFAADPTGTWTWAVHSPSGDLATTAKIESKDGKVTGAYSNEFGESAINNASLEGDVLAFEVVRDFGGNKFVVKYRGKIEGDTIKGTIELPNFGGGEMQKLDWSAKRTTSAK